MANNYGYAAATDLTLTNQTPIESQLITRQHSDAQHGGLPIHGDTAGANPIFGLAA